MLHYLNYSIESINYRSPLAHYGGMDPFGDEEETVPVPITPRARTQLGSTASALMECKETMKKLVSEVALQREQNAEFQRNIMRQKDTLIVKKI